VKLILKLVLGISAVGLLAAGCSSNQAAPPKASVTSAVTTACHDFGNQIIVHGSTTGPAQRIQLATEIANAQNKQLTKQANAMKAAIAAQDGSATQKASQNIARICYNLGLLNKNGQPT
jgi:hypothetical protein